MQVVKLLCNAVQVGLPLTRVVEVAGRVHVTPLARPAGPVQGYIRYRGVPLPVVDLRERLTGTAPAPRLSDHLVIATLRSGIDAGTSRRVALLVDRVLGLTELAVEEATPAPASATGVAGLLETPDGLLVIADLDHLLSLEEERAVLDALDPLEVT